MPSFQISSRSTADLAPGPSKKRVRRLPYQRIIIAHLGVIVVGVLFGLLLAPISLSLFILLPVLVSLVTTRTQRYQFAFLNGRLAYILLTACLLLIYYGIIAIGEVVIHPPNTPGFILVCTTLTWTVLLDPVRTYALTYLDRRFNLRDREAVKAIEAFNTTLREEIDLDQLRERLLTVIQNTMQPQSVSLWVRKTQQNDQEDLPEITVASDDPFMAYTLSHPYTIEVEKLQLASPVARTLKENEVALALPLISQKDLIGLLTLGERLDAEDYTYENRSLLNTLATQAAPALRVAQMVQERQEQVREHERIEQELRTARFIQLSLLPAEMPQLPGWQIAPYYQPAREVGGDFYDFLRFEDGRLGLIIGDVTDKGVPAALVMAKTQAMLRTIAQEQVSPSEALARVNELLHAEIPAKMFVTCFYAILDTGSGRMTFANAGHDLPYQRHNGGSEELWATGMPLGLMPGIRYEEREAILAPGDSLLLYSDGLVEAHNVRREMFGFPRLKALLEAYADERPLIEFLLSELKSFTGPGWEQEDDVTLVVVHYQR
jgi:serine phosphatase RsbU (regulator of sigma subunit)